MDSRSLDLEALPPRFFTQGTEAVARGLLGQLLLHRHRGRIRVGRIVETEAYLGPHDLACHSSRGRTRRTEAMYGAPGSAYVFLVYGMHYCLNVVTGGGAAVLLRAVEPVLGIGPGVRCDGPGRLTAVFGISLSHNQVLLSGPPLYLAARGPVAARSIARGPRIGVEYAGAWAKKPLRFWLRGDPFVSGQTR